MKAIVYEKYGSPDIVLKLKEVEQPIPKDNEVLIKVHATAINFADSGLVRGKPYLGRLWQGLFKPKKPILGSEVAGRVEAVGENVKRFQTDDEVFCDIGDIGFGGFAEYVSVPENVVVLKPTNLTFEEAAVVPVSSVVALEGLRDHGQIQSRQKILINGASGGIGTFAVQIAKTFGAEVTGVCSTKKLDLVRSIGADHVIDYTKENFTKSDLRYDLIFDIAVTHSISDYKRALNPKGAYIACGYNPTSLFLGPLISIFGRKKVKSYMAKINTKDLTYMKELIESGKVKPVIDRRYPLSKVPEAIRYYEEKHSQGKISITVVK
ncbi:MAG: NAD(P)-dependent alcohol dehydrogenase [Asgard group archaeon]|nr:NAD(P)-dependent alcohol dehydrogenase [Asgard group archaeon]